MGSLFSSGSHSADDAHDDKDLQRIDAYDQNAVKNLLDDTIVEFFKEEGETSIHYGWDNLKILLMVLASILAALSHFFKHPKIPEEHIVFACVGSFFFIHGLLFLYAHFIEQDIVARVSKKGIGSRIIVRSDFPPAQDNFSISMELEGHKGKQVDEKLYVGKFFDEEGYFDKDGFTKEIKAVFGRLQTLKTQ
ncbi:TPA: hypothetical protein N0F65_004302 [Lagenidium giganteum]|uniref:Signal peptidase complex subunit 2 n=1 Tax=Lagenidium giganteum TaxID=4803 RepID=A0AAV2ZE11_9STRA|nr:TPA: hypothetical protein N0F65_004302 [Lagenidium giganteum]